MILRLQSEQELELLQSRIKAKSTSIKGHMNGLREERGTGLEMWPGAKKEPAGQILKAKLLKTRSRTHQERATASNKVKVASDKDYWAKTLQAQCRDCHFPIPILEHRFHDERKWRFDCAWPNLGGQLELVAGIAVEIEGGIWNRGRHTRGKGFLQDCEKYNEATRLGWRVYRFTPNQVKTRVAIEYLKKILL